MADHGTVLVISPATVRIERLLYRGVVLLVVVIVLEMVDLFFTLMRLWVGR